VAESGRRKGLKIPRGLVPVRVQFSSRAPKNQGVYYYKIDPFFNRTYLKKVFWPNLCVGSSFELLGILEYACGLNLVPALILNKNPIFEMASITYLKNNSKHPWLCCYTVTKYLSDISHWWTPLFNLFASPILGISQSSTCCKL
jgi:hypothetical protein